MHKTFFVLFLLFLHSSLYSETKDTGALPRTIIALFDSQHNGSKDPTEIFFTNIHQFAETPLNYLGYILVYHDIRKPLPDITNDPDVLGVITWYIPETNILNANIYLKWAEEVIDAGKKFVILGSTGFNGYENYETVNHFWQKMGLYDRGGWTDASKSIQLTENNPSMVNFESPYPEIRPGYHELQAVEEGIQVHLSATPEKENPATSCLVMTSPKGGYAAEDYEIYAEGLSSRPMLKWYINPFEFFRLAFDHENIPKPDPTTIAGRRIFYGQIDGDGWNSVSILKAYRNRGGICAEALMNEVIKKFSDLPFTVAPIVADILLTWVGTENSHEIARQIFALDNVEVGVHTLSHPYDWYFFKNYTPEKEIPFLSRYPNGSWEPETNSTFGNFLRYFVKKKSPKSQEFSYALSESEDNYSTPRTYALEPFDLDKEIAGAIAEVQKLAPPDKEAIVLQWSGNCLVFEEALKKSREAKIYNINGGDTRFDNDYNSYAWVRPFSRTNGKERQIYASSSNENTYTNLWTEKYFAFNKLPKTWQNTGFPRRIKPMDIYFHVYSAEKDASYHALEQDLNYARKQEIAPIRTSLFCGIAEGFFTAKIEKAGVDAWVIKNRGELQTIRFDKCEHCDVDFNSSWGVIGQRRELGNLYVYLDRDVAAPKIAMKMSMIHHTKPYLSHSHWLVWGLKFDTPEQFSFTTQGFGKGDIVWQVPMPGKYEVTFRTKNDEEHVANMTANEAGLLNVSTDLSGLEPMTVKIRKIDG